MELQECRAADLEELIASLSEADLTMGGLDAPDVRLWLARDERGAIVGSAGYEVSRDGRHALIRSVAVASQSRSLGRGSALARFALERATTDGAVVAWLFSRRSGPFWQGLGFEAADRDELARVLNATHHVRLFRSTGQLDREIAWSRPLEKG